MLLPWNMSFTEAGLRQMVPNVGPLTLHGFTNFYVCGGTYGGEKTICKSQFSTSTMRTQDIVLNPPEGLVAVAFTH